MVEPKSLQQRIYDEIVQHSTSFGMIEMSDRRKLRVLISRAIETRSCDELLYFWWNHDLIDYVDLNNEKRATAKAIASLRVDLEFLLGIESTVVPPKLRAEVRLEEEREEQEEQREKEEEEERQAKRGRTA